MDSWQLCIIKQMNEFEGYDEKRLEGAKLAEVLRKIYQGAGKEISQEQIDKAVETTYKKTGVDGLRSATVVLTDLSATLNPQSSKTDSNPSQG